MAEDRDSGPPSRSAMGILMALGLVAGGAIGGFGYASPAPGALIGGALGLAVGFLLDRKAKRRDG